MKTKIVFLYISTIFILNPFLMAQIPTNGLVGYYPFNGNANDESGNGNNGVVNGATLTTDRCGNPDSAYYFNRINENYIEIFNTFDLMPRSIDLWFNADGFNYSSDYGSIFVSDNISLKNGNSGIAVKDYNGRKILLLTMSVVTDTFEIGANNWYNVAMVINVDHVIKYYINGQLIGVKSFINDSTSDGGNSRTYIGTSRYANAHFFYGKIDDIRIYNKALTDNEILSLYNSKCNIPTTDSGEINGPKDVCQGQKNVSYNVLNMNNIISYSWSYSGTGAIIGDNSDTVYIDFENNAISGNLKVLGYKTGGNGTDTATISITVNSCNQNCDSNLQEGLVAYYPFNNNANDESGNGNNAVVHGAMLTTDRCGKPDSAYYFSGSGSYIEIPSNSLSMNQYTYSLWALLNTTLSDGDRETAISIGSTNGDQYINFGNFYSSLSVYNGWGCGGYNVSARQFGMAQGITPNINQWYFLVATRETNKMKFYINSVLIAVDSLSSLTIPYYGSGIVTAKIGARHDLSLKFHGKIDEVRIYNRALTEDEILCLYKTNCINPLPDSGEISGTTIVCQGQKGVIYNVLKMNDIASYSWSYSGTGAIINGNSDSIQIDFANNATSGNLIVLGNKTGGTGTDTAILSITVNPLPSDAGTIIGDNEVCLNQNGVKYHTLPINNVSNYIWNYSGTGATIIGNSDSIIMNFAKNATSGNLTVYGNNKCGNGTLSPPFSIIMTSCDSVPSNKFNIPNSFSPNGDGINDVFFIRGLTANSKLIIFNRSGKEVYVSDNYQNNWDGNDSKGQILESGTYWYVLSMAGMPTEFKGFVYIKR